MPARPAKGRPLRALLTALLLTALPLTGAAFAQTLDADTVIENVTAAASDLQDASFLITGRLVNPDGTTLALEIDIMVIPEQSLANAYIIQPDALADNMIILDGAAVYNYTFLTNQVMIFDANDPDALGGLLPMDEEGATANLSLDLGKIFEGYDAEVIEVVEGPYGETYRLLFTNVDPNAEILDVEADVATSDWLPRRLVFIQADGHVLAELNAEQLEVNQGLDPSLLRDLPDDAEVIDNRR